MNKVHIIEHKEGLVSVVIPTYNHAHFLGKAIQSVIDQTYMHWEALVIDNNSEDNTDDVVSSFNDKRIKLYKINNKGVIAASRNLGIQKACGKWVAFLDSDDWWYPEKLDMSVRVLKNGAQLVCHAEDWIKNGSKFRTVKYGPKNKATYRQLLFGKNCISTSAVTIQRASLSQVGSFTESSQAVGVEDYHLWIKLAKAGFKFEFIDQALGCYRIYDMSQSNNLIKQMNSERWVLKDHFKAQIQMSILDYIYKYRRITRVYVSIALRWFLRILSRL